LWFMDAIIDSFEEQVDTILKEIRGGFASIFSDQIPHDIVSFLDEGLTIDLNHPKSVDDMVLYLVQIDKLSEQLGFEGKDPVTMVDGPEKLLAMLISVLRCVIGQLISGSEPSTSKGGGRTTLQSALEEVRKEMTTSDDENSEAINVNEREILGALNDLNWRGTSGYRRPVIDSAMLAPQVVRNRPIIDKGHTLSKHLDFSEAEQQGEKVELATECCPFCPLNFHKTNGSQPRPGLYTRHIREVHRERWTSYAKIKCAAKECDYRAINFHSMKCHCYAMHTQQYDSWIEEGRFNLPPGSQCPFCRVTKGEEVVLENLGQYKLHLDEAHLEEIHKYSLSLGCSCKKKCAGTWELFTHWGKDLCTGTPLIVKSLSLRATLPRPPSKK
ncbi:hypothetical protein PMAYCL1PPCAC_17409, partial [Pristionchus mayeri]